MEVLETTSVVAVVVPVVPAQMEMNQHPLAAEEMVVLELHSQHMPHQLLDPNSQ